MQLVEFAHLVILTAWTMAVCTLALLEFANWVSRKLFTIALTCVDPST